MGIIPLFDWGEANAPFYYLKFTLINNDKSMRNVFEVFGDTSSALS